MLEIAYPDGENSAGLKKLWVSSDKAIHAISNPSPLRVLRVFPIQGWTQPLTPSHFTFSLHFIQRSVELPFWKQSSFDLVAKGQSFTVFSWSLLQTSDVFSMRKPYLHIPAARKHIFQPKTTGSLLLSFFNPPWTTSYDGSLIWSSVLACSLCIHSASGYEGIQ